VIQPKVIIGLDIMIAMVNPGEALIKSRRTDVKFS